MSWSLQVRNGDLTLGQSQFGTVTDEAKLVQDLRCFVLERMGTDNMHPEFGSLLDGGVTPAGVTYPGVIGNPNDGLSRTYVETEIRRIIREYQIAQLDRAQADRLHYGRPTLTKREILIAVERIVIVQSLDTMTVNLLLLTGANQTLDVSFGFTT